MFSNQRNHIILYSPARIFTGFLLLISVNAAMMIPVGAQEPTKTIQDSLDIVADSLIQVADTVVTDTLPPGEKKRNVLEAPVKYASVDSFIISMGEQKTYLFKEASVDYQNISLKANYIEFDLGSNTVLAGGTLDSTGQLAGKPVFIQGADQYDSDTIRYNFETHKGIIKQIITKQGDGYLHSTLTKRLADGEIHIRKGKYTTCDDPHPHFYIQLSKAIAIPQEKIVSGPAYMVMEDIPLPLALPFGFFPNTTTRASGLIIPTYGEEKERGFYLRNGGWYFAVNDYMDFTLLGSVYSRGTWAVSGSSVYKVRYRFTGRFNIEYVNNRVNDDPTFEASKDFRVTWSHSQDPKANPTRQFSANVNFSTTSFEKNQSYDINDYLTNTKTSSISYRKSWSGSPFNLTANLQHSQNSKTHIVNMSLPTMAFNMNRIYPFRGKNDDGKYNWLENIQVSYNAKLENRIKSPDSTFFTSKTLEQMKNGFSHTIPISLTNIKLLKFINITPGINYSGVLYTDYIVKKNNPDSSQFITTIEVDTIHKVTYAQALSTSLGISVSPKIYGMFQSTKPNSYIAFVRHVITPTASFSFSPDMSSLMPDYYRKAVSPQSVTKPVTYDEYSVYEQEIYGTPSANGRSGSLSLGLNNNLEMKVRPKNDTTGELKKVSILDNFNFSTAYNPFAKSFQWSPLNMRGTTRLFNKKVDVNFGATFNPYALDSTGKKVDRFLIHETGKLFRTTRANIDVGFKLQSPAGDKGKSSESTSSPDEFTETSNPTLDMLDETTAYMNDYVDFNIPWTLNVDYSWSYNKEGLVASYQHTIRVSGDISITPKWKIGGNTGYDFVSKAFSTTNLSIHRDLHCWEMRFTVVPFGDRRSYSFSINAKSSILRDVKYNKNKSWRDNF
jgi:hypothetical protein